MSYTTFPTEDAVIGALRSESSHAAVADLLRCPKSRAPPPDERPLRDALLRLFASSCGSAAEIIRILGENQWFEVLIAPLEKIESPDVAVHPAGADSAQARYSGSYILFYDVHSFFKAEFEILLQLIKFEALPDRISPALVWQAGNLHDYYANYDTIAWKTLFSNLFLSGTEETKLLLRTNFGEGLREAQARVDFERYRLIFHSFRKTELKTFLAELEFLDANSQFPKRVYVIAAVTQLLGQNPILEQWRMCFMIAREANEKMSRDALQTGTHQSKYVTWPSEIARRLQEAQAQVRRNGNETFVDWAARIGPFLSKYHASWFLDNKTTCVEVYAVCKEFESMLETRASALGYTKPVNLANVIMPDIDMRTTLKWLCGLFFHEKLEQAAAGQTAKKMKLSQDPCRGLQPVMWYLLLCITGGRALQVTLRETYRLKATSLSRPAARALCAAISSTSSMESATRATQMWLTYANERARRARIGATSTATTQRIGLYFGEMWHKAMLCNGTLKKPQLYHQMCCLSEGQSVADLPQSGPQGINWNAPHTFRGLQKCDRLQGGSPMESSVEKFIKFMWPEGAEREPPELPAFPRQSRMEAGDGDNNNNLGTFEVDDEMIFDFMANGPIRWQEEEAEAEAAGGGPASCSSSSRVDETSGDDSNKYKAKYNRLLQEFKAIKSRLQQVLLTGAISKSTFKLMLDEHEHEHEHEDDDEEAGPGRSAQNKKRQRTDENVLERNVRRNIGSNPDAPIVIEGM